MKSGSVTRIFCVALLAACSFASAAALADVARRIDIPAGDLAAALKSLARQAGVELIYRTEQIRGLKTRGVSGELLAEDAARKLLEGTSLTVRVDSSGALSIAPPAGADLGAAADQMRLAATAGADPNVDGDSKEARDSSQVVVEGQRDRVPPPFSTANLDLTRTQDDALPFTVFTARDLELSGASNLTEFLQNRLPQNFSSTIFEETNGTGIVNNAGSVDMRGWGDMETVFLLNGRRMPAQYQRFNLDNTNATPNLQGIPLASIERVEILSSAGSAIYGASATAGVINIITRQDFRGGQMSVNYETPADTSAPRRAVDFSYGMPLKWGLGLRLGGGYNDSEPLHVGDRADVSILRWRRLVMERQPTRFINSQGNSAFLTSSQFYGATPNIRGIANNSDIFASIAGAQNYTSVPVGSLGNTPASGYQPGVYNLGLAPGSAGNSLVAENSTLGTSNTNSTVTLGLDRSFGSNWRWSLDYRYTQLESVGSIGGALSFVTPDISGSIPRVPADVPTNPFGQPVRVYLVDPYLDRPELTSRPRNETWDLSSTLRGTFGEWNGYFDVSYSHNSNRYLQSSYYEPGGGWVQAFRTGRYNPFVDPRVRAPGVPGFYDDYIAGRGIFDSATRSWLSSAKVSGPVFRMPAGDVQGTFGLEGSRVDRYRSSYVQQFEDGVTGVLRSPTDLAPGDFGVSGDAAYNRRYMFDSYSAYTEFNVPLLSAAQQLPLVNRLELFVSARLDHAVRKGFEYDWSGVAGSEPTPPVKYTDTSHLLVYGLRYDMLEGLMFRATFSTGFRPPYMEQLAPQPSTSPYEGIEDPVRDELVDLQTDMYFVGGNPGLLPETTDSTNIGMVLTPKWVPGFRLSVDYVKSVRNDAIFTLTPQEAIALEGEIPGIVTRGPADGDPSGVGPITFLDMRSVNLRKLASESLDFTLEQRLGDVRGGQLILTAAATKNLSFKVQSSNTGTAVEQVRNRAGALVSRQVEWNGNAQLRWEGPRWSMGWSARYYDYILVRTQDFLLQGSDRAPWKVNHDFYLGYNSPTSQNPTGAQWLLSGTSLTVGVKNAFDREPRFWAQATDRGVASFDSLMGRSVWMQMRKNFN